MGILEMTYVSYFFILLSAVLGMAAAAMYFIFDIKQCWRIVRGTYSMERKHTVSGKAKTPLRQPAVLNTSEGPKPFQVCESTVLLAPEETEPLPVMQLVQDIVMGDMENKIIGANGGLK